MRHFIAYHNVERIGQALAAGDPFSVVTNKPVEGLAGALVWFVEGSSDRPKQYRLSSVFRVDETGKADGGSFKNYASGEGHLFSEGPLLNRREWFREIFESTAHFSVGLQEIKNPGWISSLAQLSLECGFDIASLGHVPLVYQDLDRTATASARRVFEMLFPDADVRLGICELLAESIRYADSVSPRGWGITLYRNRVRLNVGQVEVLVLSRDDVHLNILSGGLTEEQLHSVSPYAVENHYRTIPEPHLLLHIPPEFAPSISRVLRHAREAFIARAAERKRSSPWKSSHSPGVLGYLEEVLGRALPVPEYATNAGTVEPEPQISSYGAGFGDPESNRRIEQAAVAFVTDSYRQGGWNVASVERDRCGYDLLCRRGSDEEHVEVKGVGGGELMFILTAGEAARARSDPRFRVAVVTRAVDEPELRSWGGRELWECFQFDPIAYRVQPKRETEPG